MMTLKTWPTAKKSAFELGDIFYFDGRRYSDLRCLFASDFRPIYWCHVSISMFQTCFFFNFNFFNFMFQTCHSSCFKRTSCEKVKHQDSIVVIPWFIVEQVLLKLLIFLKSRIVAKSQTLA